MSSFSPTGTLGISSTLIFISPIPLAHIKSTDDWTRVECELEKWLNHHPLLSFRENDPLFSTALHVSRFFTHGRAEERKAASGYMKSYFRGDMAKEPLWWFSFLHYSLLFYMDGLFKKNGTVDVVFFLSTVHGKFSRKMNLFHHHIYVYSLKCHQIFRYFHLQNLEGVR